MGQGEGWICVPLGFGDICLYMGVVSIVQACLQGVCLPGVLSYCP